LIGFRNRILVLIQWAWSYLTYERGSRLITGDQTLPSWPELVQLEESSSKDKKTA
jgi:NADH dehydrogenase